MPRKSLKGKASKFKRTKTKYPGISYLMGKSRATGKDEKIFYVSFYRDGERHNEPAGREGVDEMTALKASKIRTAKMEGRLLSNRERRAAEEAAAEALAGKWTFARLFKEYQEQHPGKKLANEKSRFKNYLSPAFGDKMPEEIDPLAVDRLRISLLKKLKPGTVLAILELFRRLCNFAKDKRLCAGLSFTVKMPKVDNLKTEDLTREELARLLKVLRGERLDDDPPDADTSVNADARDIMLLALFTGMRRGEIFKLTWDAVNFERGFITLRAPKGGQSQSIPLSSAAREVLKSRPRQDRKEEDKEPEYVFPGRDGGQRTDVKKALEKIRERAKLPGGFRPLHGLRHHFASTLASSGQVDLFTLQRLLTHKSPAMTQRYAHLRDDTLRRASELAGRLVAGATEPAAKKSGATNN